MSVEDARRYARRARKLAPTSMYDVARSLEKAVESMADEIEALKEARETPGGGAPDRKSVSRARSSGWS